MRLRTANRRRRNADRRALGSVTLRWIFEVPGVQLLDTRAQFLADVCRIFGVPKEFVSPNLADMVRAVERQANEVLFSSLLPMEIERRVMDARERPVFLPSELLKP